jgi:hypothetical protein
MVLAQGKSRRLKAGLGGPNQKDEEGLSCLAGVYGRQTC